MNVVIIMGNLTRDPEIKTVGANNTAVANFGIAFNKKFTSNGQKVEKPVFINCEAWGRTAESIGEYSYSGQKVLVEGEWDQDTWEDKETGQKRTKDKLRVNRINMLSWRDNVGSNSNSNQEPAAATAGAGAANDGDVPF